MAMGLLGLGSAPAHAAIDPENVKSSIPACSSQDTLKKIIACEQGFKANRTSSAKVDTACSQFKDDSTLLGICKTGFNANKRTSTDNTAKSLQEQACVGKPASDQSTCQAAVLAGLKSSQSESEACKDIKSFYSQDYKEDVCKTNYALGKSVNTAGGKKAEPTAESAAKAEDGAKETGEDNCTLQGGALAWIMCPAIRLMNGTVNMIMTSIVQPLLEVTPLRHYNGDGSVNGIWALWSVLRDLANVGFVLIFLVIVFANTLSINLNAYAVKKMLPRLVAAAILVQFSFLLCSVMVDIGNVLGGGIAQLTQQVDDLTESTLVDADGNRVDPGPEATPAGYMVTGLVVIIGGLIAFSVVGVPGVLLFIFAALIGAMAVGVTLVVRQLIISCLVVMSPLALALWVLPGTEGIFKKWQQNFVKLILMYPIVILIFSVARVLGQVTSQSAALNEGATIMHGTFTAVGALAGTPALAATAGEVASAKLQSFIAALFPLIAFFMIPATFKMAGGVLGAAGNFINKGGSKVGGGLRNSQMAKDAKQNRKERELMRMNEATTTFGKLRGKAGSGNLMSRGTVAARRNAIAYNKLREDRTKDTLARLDTLGISDKNDLKNLALGNTAGRQLASKHKLEMNDSTRMAAIRQLAQQKDFATLSDIRTNASAPGTSASSLADQSRVWRAATSPIMGDIAKAAPHIANQMTDASSGAYVPPKMDALVSGMTADKFANLDHSTVTTALQHIQTAGNSAQKQAMLQSLQGVINSGGLRNKVNNKTVDAVMAAVNSGAFNGTQLTMKDGTTASGGAYLRGQVVTQNGHSSFQGE